MTIRELRAVTGKNQTDFGKLYGIPLRTIQNWETCARNPPEYVFNLLDRAVKQDFPGAYSDHIANK